MEKTHKILEIEDIHTYYGESHAIQGLSLFVNAHEAVSILGRNGVGKTTTLRSIMGLTPPRSGSITIDGQKTIRWPAHRVSRLGVAYVPAERHIFPGLTVKENLKIAARPGNGESPARWSGFTTIFRYWPIAPTRMDLRSAAANSKCSRSVGR